MAADKVAAAMTVHTQRPGALHRDRLPRAAAEVRDQDRRRRHQRRHSGVTAGRQVGRHPGRLLDRGCADA